jgi:hypothetical protein
MSKQQIEYYTKNVYGQELMYILDSDMATYFQALTGKKTINETDMHLLSKMFGVEFKEVLAPKGKRYG